MTQPLKYFLSLSLAAFLFLARHLNAAATNPTALPPVVLPTDSPIVGPAKAPSIMSTNATPLSQTNAAPAPAVEAKKSPDDLIQLSFQGANVDMIVQWLAENTGKSVVKHPQVQCQITIVGSKKVTRRDAITLIYRALAIEGFAAIESADSILLVPEGKEPKSSPEMAGAEMQRAGSRDKVVKVFPLQHVLAAVLKDKIKNVLSEKATIETSETANALIITDYNDNVTVAGQLIAALDTDRPQEVQVRVISLKNANAAELAKELTPLYEKLAGKDSKEILQVTANDRSNTLMILSSEANFRAIEKLIGSLDTEDAQDSIMRSFVLKNADSEDVSRQLQDLYKEPASGEGGRMRFYGMGPEPSPSKTSPKMSVVSDRRRNAIIVQASPAQMESVSKMVEALDEPLKDDSLAPKIFVLKYVSASDIEDVLNELFLKKTQQRTYWFSDEPAEPVADRDVGRLYGKVRITSEPYSNAIIVTSNSGENLAAVEEVLRELDVPSQAGETTFRVGLRFADAPVMANNVNILFAKGGAPPLRSNAANNPNQQPQQNQQQQGQQPQSASESNFEVAEQVKEDGYYPWLGGQPDVTRSSDTRAQRPVSDLIGRVRVVPDQRSNSLLISANVHFFPQILKLIEEMDVPTAEVMIEARIVEVSSDFLDQLGVRWSPDGTATFTAADYDNSVVLSANGQYQKGFGGRTSANSPGPNNNSTTTTSVTSALSTLRSGGVNNTISVDFLIQFLREHTDATVLAEPQIEIRDNELGKLFVGQQVPFISGSLTTDVGGLNQSFQYKDVGVILEVEPHINESGDVALRIRTESSTIVPGQTLLGGAIIDTRNFRTELTAKSGQTLILGGIIQKQITATMRKTPLLGSIPGLKWAFNKKDNQTQRVELLVFLRPKVTRTPQEAQALLNEVNKRMPLIQNWEQTELDSRDYRAKPPTAKP